MTWHEINNGHRKQYLTRHMANKRAQIHRLMTRQGTPVNNDRRLTDD